MEKLVRAVRNADRRAIVVRDLIGTKAGDSPHTWYDPATMLTLAQSRADALGSADPAHRDGYQQYLDTFRVSVVGATETASAGKTYHDWIVAELGAIDRALPKQTP